MTVHDWFEEQREAYVLRLLDDDEMRSFAEHLPKCEHCREDVAALERELGLLAMGAAPVAPSPGLQRRLRDGVLAPRRRAAPTRAPWLAAAAAVLLAAGTTTLQLRRTSALEARLAEQGAALSALQDSLAGFRSATKVMQASFAMHGEQGGLVVLADEQRHVWRVVVHGPAAPDGEDYLICFITPDGLKHAITVGRGGAPSVHTLEMPKDGTPVLGAALLMEPRSAPADRPEIPIAEVRL